MDASKDAFGHALVDAREGRPAFEFVERDDGFVALSPGPPQYLAPVERWLGLERAALRWVRGRVLDVGCGGGRVALCLEKPGDPRYVAVIEKT